MRPLPWLLAPLLGLTPALHAQTAPSQSSPDSVQQAPTLEPRLWTVGMSLASVFDSNIDHDEANLRSYGMVGGLDARWRSSLDDPLLVLQYDAGLHSYSGTDRWDRVSHHARGVLEREFGDWTLELIGDASLKGSTEDRGIGDEYALIPRAEYEIDDVHRIRLAGAYRIKQEEDADRDARNRYAEVEFRQKLEGSRTWEVGYRYESNQTRSQRNRYIRWTTSVEYETPVGARDHLALEAKYRAKRYPDRMVEVEDEDVSRRDHQWIPGLFWTHALRDGNSVRIGYEFETRSSNDPEKDFGAHRLWVTLLKSW